MKKIIKRVAIGLAVMVGIVFLNGIAAQVHYEASISCPMRYPEYSRTHFNLGKVSIMVHEGLFRYLQDRGWLSRYVADYRTTNWWVAQSGR